MIKLISKGKKKAEIILIEDTTHGKVYKTLHLLLKESGVWKDNYGNTYKL